MKNKKYCLNSSKIQSQIRRNRGKIDNNILMLHIIHIRIFLSYKASRQGLQAPVLLIMTIVQKNYLPLGRICAG